MRPRRQRWISVPEVLENLSQKYPAFAKKVEGRPRKRQLEMVRRLVRRAERRDAWRFTKRVDGELFVSLNALEALLPVNAESLSKIERDQDALDEKQRTLQRQVNGHGSKIRELEQRVQNLEEIQEHLATAQQANTNAIALIARGRGAP